MADKCAAAEDKALALRIAHTQAREAMSGRVSI